MLGALIGGAVGALGGALGSSSSQNSTAGIRVAPETALEKHATQYLDQNLGQLNDLTQAGPGTQDQTSYVNSTRSLASMLQNYSTGGYLPTSQDTGYASGLADQLLNPSFRQQGVEADRLAARLGRPVNDPIIQNKLRQGLADQRSTFIANRAQQMPLERLGFAQQLSSVNEGLATRAFANRQALMQAGNTLREADRNYRINTGERYGNTSQQSGGGLGGAIAGAMGGMGTGFNFENAALSLQDRYRQQPSGAGGFNSGSFSNGGFGSMSSPGGYGLGGVDYGFNPSASFGGFSQQQRTPAMQQFRSAATPSFAPTPSAGGYGGTGDLNSSSIYLNGGGRVPVGLASPDIYNQSGFSQGFNSGPQFNIYGGGY